MGVRVREKVKGSGVYWVFVADKGRRRSVKTGDKKKVNEVARRMQIEFDYDPDTLFIKRKEHKPKPKPKFRELSEQWLEDVASYAKSTTVARYTQLLNDRVLPAVGSKKIDQVKKADIIQTIKKAQRDGLATPTLGLIRTCFSGPMDIACLEEHIPANLANGVLKQMKINRRNEKNNNVGTSKNLKYFTLEQIDRFRTTCQKDFPEYYPFYMFLFLTGTRLGEALALTWDDINWKKKRIEINKAFRTELSTTKTGEEREIDLSDSLAEILKQLRDTRKKEAWKSREQMVDIIFHQNGRYMRQNQARRIFKRILQIAELPDHRLHDSFASIQRSTSKTPASAFALSRGFLTRAGKITV